MMVMLKKPQEGKLAVVKVKLVVVRVSILQVDKAEIELGQHHPIREVGMVKLMVMDFSQFITGRTEKLLMARAR